MAKNLFILATEVIEMLVEMLILTIWEIYQSHIIAGTSQRLQVVFLLVIFILFADGQIQQLSDG